MFGFCGYGILWALTRRNLENNSVSYYRIVPSISLPIILINIKFLKYSYVSLYYSIWSNV